MTARVLRWLIFSVLISLLPLSLDFLMAASRAGDFFAPSIKDVIGRGELCLIAVTLTAVGAGEVAGAEMRDARIGIVLIGVSFINAILGIALYVVMKSAAASQGALIFISVVTFVSTIVVATSCIVASESKRA